MGLAEEHSLIIPPYCPTAFYGSPAISGHQEFCLDTVIAARHRVEAQKPKPSVHHGGDTGWVLLDSATPVGVTGPLGRSFGPGVSV